MSNEAWAHIQTTYKVSGLKLVLSNRHSLVSPRRIGLGVGPVGTPARLQATNADPWVALKHLDK